MNAISPPSRYAAGGDQQVRGDTITAERYTSKAWMDKENENLWPRVWHLGAVIAELEEEGDFVRHDLGKESVIMVKQEDGSVKAFYNACPHRGNRLIVGDSGSVPRITCGYHGWQFTPDGVLAHVQDPDDFEGGNPCGKVTLTEIRCETWGPFVWWNMDLDAKPVVEWLAPYPEKLAGYGLDNWVRVFKISADADFNWKIIRDNFNESYHLPTIHPELATFINDGLPTTEFAMYDSGHNSMWMVGHQATTRVDYHSMEVPAPLDDIARAWGVNPDDYNGRTGDIRQAVIEAKRKLGPERGYTNYKDMSDQQLVDYFHCTMFPNLTLTMSPEQCQILRTEPHPTDPEKCIFQHWCLYPPIPGMKEVETPIGPVPLKHDAIVRHSVVGDGVSVGFVADQDISIGTTQQQGLNSRGFKGCILTNQEKRIQRFHELLNDYVQRSDLSMTIPSERKRVMQICFVVPDIDAAMQSWTETMGIGPFFIFRDLDIDTVKHRGTPTRVRFHIAMAQAGGVQIELAQQVSDAPYAYNEVFPNGSDGGLHHIAIYVADYAAALKHFTDQGIEPSVTGLFGEMNFAYVDTRAQLGCMVEIIEHHALQDQIFARVKEGAETWDGVTDPVRPGLPD